MRGPSAAELLDLWQQGRPAAPVQRGLLLLAAAEPDAARAELAALSVGRRDARLLRLRAGLFGPRLEALAGCPGCGARLELVLETDTLARAAEPGEGGPASITLAGYRVRFRVPDSADLLAALAQDGDAARKHALLERCVVEVLAPDGARAALPAELEDEVGAAMAAADPAAELLLALSCPECAASWSAPLDVLAFLWAEIEAWARRTLREVDRLATRYGWSEREILALSPARRAAYLEFAGA